MEKRRDRSRSWITAGAIAAGAILAARMFNLAVGDDLNAPPPRPPH